MPEPEAAGVSEAGRAKGGKRRNRHVGRGEDRRWGIARRGRPAMRQRGAGARRGYEAGGTGTGTGTLNGRLRILPARSFPRAAALIYKA